ncbi:hypothetical protein [Flammeovirga sp. EKP202]|uniref:hypothetical protein n=1 Tax=Flammeovirga sp. EKP202 TaxID=2770592 RepID=UPI00165FDE9D|nr:hypothetical protein [Flammeovirga sp. EKP202]MBD0401946.1 hypothetical protein [Flammeovirga sp. EKP202]
MKKLLTIAAIICIAATTFSCDPQTNENVEPTKVESISNDGLEVESPVGQISRDGGQ